VPPAEFEPAIPGSEWPQTNALDRATTGIGESIWIDGIKRGSEASFSPRISGFRAVGNCISSPHSSMIEAVTTGLLIAPEQLSPIEAINIASGGQGVTCMKPEMRVRYKLHFFRCCGINPVGKCFTHKVLFYQC
jgi:hypothetical protein